jgi:KDPG and KHG aldolase
MKIPGAIDVISNLTKNNPSLMLGVGSVLDLATAKQCVDAGAHSLTTTGLDLELVHFAGQQNVGVFPGVLTPTEVMAPAARLNPVPVWLLSNIADEGTALTRQIRVGRSWRVEQSTCVSRNSFRKRDEIGYGEGEDRGMKTADHTQRCRFSILCHSTIFFGTDTLRGTARVVQRSRFSFFREAQIWYSRDPEHYPVSDQFENVIVLSDEFYREIVPHPIPADLEAVKVLAAAPAVWTYSFELAGAWVAFLPLVCNEGKGDHSAVWTIRSGQPDRIDRIRASTPVSRKA